MQQCGKTYTNALLLSAMVHVAVVGSALFFAGHGEAFRGRDLRSITVSLMRDADPGSLMNEPSARKKQHSSVPAAAQMQELNNTLPSKGDLSRETPPTGGSDNYEETALNGPRSSAHAGGDQRETGEITFGQRQLVHTALDRAKTYPRMARERGVEGVVRVRFKVLPTGEIEKVDILQSSGSDVLDKASVRTVYRAAPMPYVNGWVEVPMTYVLE